MEKYDASVSLEGDFELTERLNRIRERHERRKNDAIGFYFPSLDTELEREKALFLKRKEWLKEKGERDADRQRLHDNAESLCTVDLYEIHVQKAMKGISTIHPSRWLHARSRFKILNVNVFDTFSMGHAESMALLINGNVMLDAKSLSIARSYNNKTRRVVRHKHDYYLATPALAKRYLEYVPPSTLSEWVAIDILSVLHPEATTEMSTPVGFIDVLLPGAVIEIKSMKNWKHALGQIVAYSYYHPTLERIIYLCGMGADRNQKIDLREVTRICASENVKVEYVGYRPYSSELLKIEQFYS